MEMVSSLGLHVEKLALSVRFLRVVQEYIADPVCGPVALSRTNEIDFSVVSDSGWFPLSSKESTMFDLNLFLHLRRSSIMHLAASVLDRNE